MSTGVCGAEMLNSDSPVGVFSGENRQLLSEGKEPVNLIAYYRERLAKFDLERAEWLNRLDQVKTSAEEKHKLAWELQKRREEVADMQRGCSEVRVALFDERQANLQLKRENEELNLKVQEDRKKIAELLSIIEPVEQDVVLARDLRPEVTTKFSKNDLNINANKERVEQYARKPKSLTGAMTQPLGTTQHRSILKTIYMPSEQVNTLNHDMDILKSKMEEERQFYASEIERLRSELREREETHAIQEKNQNLSLHEALNKNKKLELLITNINKDYFEQRIRFENQQRRLEEEAELLRMKNAKLTEDLASARRQLEIDTRTTKELAEKKTNDYTSKYKQQLRIKEEGVQVIKEQYQKAQKIYLEKSRD